MAELVRTPAVLAGYACGRSLACCARPWRAVLQPGEADTIAQLLAVAADPGLTPQQWQDSLVNRPPAVVLRQPDGVCSWLDEDQPGCRIQRAAGLAAMPKACQNFPRSVVATPLGIEIAWTLACPTAAGIVARRPASWQWQPVANSPYPPARQVGDRVAVSRVADWQFGEVMVLREQWWRRLAHPDGLVQTLWAMVNSPLHPHASPLPDDSAIAAQLAPAWTSAQVGPVSEALGRLRDTGPQHRDQLRQYWAAWMAPAGGRVVRDQLDTHRHVLACHAALGLQHAGVHDGGAVGEGIIAAARQTVAAARAMAALATTPQPVRDGLVAAAHWARG